MASLLLFILLIALISYIFWQHVLRREDKKRSDQRERYQIKLSSKLLERLRMEDLLKSLTNNAYNHSEEQEVFKLVVNRLKEFLPGLTIHFYEMSEYGSLDLINDQDQVGTNKDISRLQVNILKRTPRLNQIVIHNSHDQSKTKIKSLISVPLLSNNEVDYLLVASHAQMKYFDEFHIEVFKMVATICNLRIDNIRHLNNLRILEGLRQEVKNRKFQLSVQQEIASNESAQSAITSKPHLLVIESLAGIFDFMLTSLNGFYHITYSNTSENKSIDLSNSEYDLIITDCKVLLKYMLGSELKVPLIYVSGSESCTGQKDLPSNIKWVPYPYKLSQLISEISLAISLSGFVNSPFHSSLISNLNIEESQNQFEFVETAIKIVEANMTNDDFRVEDFQRILGVSRTQLHRRLRKLVDSSASEFIREVRLAKAFQMLCRGNTTVSEAAYNSGFSHLSYFAKCFKSKHGITPKEFINSLNSHGTNRQFKHEEFGY